MATFKYSVSDNFFPQVFTGTQEAANKEELYAELVDIYTIELDTIESELTITIEEVETTEAPKFTKGTIIKMTGLKVKKENGVFEIENPWEKACSVYKLKKDGSRIKHGLDIFNYDKIEKYGEIITLDQVSAAITEINKQLKARKDNEIVVTYVNSDNQEYTNKSYIRVIKSIHTTTSIYAIPTNSIFQITVNEKLNNVVWKRIGKRGEVITSGDKSLMSWKSKSMDKLFAEGYLEVVERVETVRKDMEEVNEVNETIEVSEPTETIEEVVNVENVNVVSDQVETTNETEVTNDVTVSNEVVSDSIQSNSIEATYKTNTGKNSNGIEIYFTDKPDEETRNQLKANGYKWAKYNKCWWTIETPERLEFAKSICNESNTINNETNETETETVYNNYPEIEIDDLESGLYNISQDLQDREHDSAWVFRTSKRDHNKELIELFQSYRDKVISVIESTDNKYYISKLKEALQRFKKNYHATYIKWLSQKANNPSWAVTGRSGRNMSQYNKKLSQQDKTMGELVDLPKQLELIISKYQSKIKRDKEQQLRQQMENTNVDIQFTTKQKQFEYMGIKENKRVYVYNQYWICKLWNCFRVFYNDKEIKTNLKTTDTLGTAKKYVTMLVNSQQSA